VLLNGVPGKTIHCRRGVRQRDPLSPLLFVLAADLLQSLVNEAFKRNLISLPLSTSYGQDYPIVQYTDDTLIIMPTIAKELFFFKCLLQSFIVSTRLKVNFSKFFIVPINVSEEKTNILAGTLGCQIGTMPFTYLDLPLGTTKLLVKDFMPILSRIEKRLMGIIPFASYAGRLTLVNAILLALPTYHMCVLAMPVEIIDQINKYRKHCLWRGSNINKKGNCLAAWNKVQRPKSQGGLAVINLAIQNKALLFKHLHKFFNKADVPWVDLTWKAFYIVDIAPQARNSRLSFWWRALCRLFDSFRGVAKPIVGRGDTTMFWKDIWNFGSLQQLYPHLFSFAKEPNYLANRFLGLLPDYSKLFQLPLSMEASHQLAELMDSLDDWNRERNNFDCWTYIWGSGIFTSKQAYNNMMGHAQAPPPFQWLWKSRCEGKHRVFFLVIAQ
jgi:hypothetical protein